MKIAVIDGFINIESYLVKGSIEKTINLRSDVINNKNYHGTIVAGLICTEMKENKIISIEILDDYNKGFTEDLLDAIDYAIAEDVDVICMSLGIPVDSQYINQLNEKCNEADEEGIVLFSAYSNTLDQSSPANHKKVIGVKYDEDVTDKLVYIDTKSRNISFSKKYLNSKFFKMNVERYDNSFLNAHVIHMFSKYCKDNLDKNRSIDYFLEFLINNIKY